MKSSFKLGIALASLFLLLGFLSSYFLPQFERWLLVEIERAIKSETGATVLPEKIRVSLFPLGVEFSQIKVSTERPLPVIIHKLENVGLYIKIFELILGYVRLDRIDLEGVVVELPDALVAQLLASDKSKSTPELVADDIVKDVYNSSSTVFSLLSKLPINRVNLRKARIFNTDKKIEIKTDLLQFRNRRPTLEISTPSIQMQYAQQSLLLGGELAFDGKTIDLAPLSAKFGQSVLETRGQVKIPPSTLAKDLTGQVYVSLEAELADLKAIESLLSIKLPRASGTLKVVHNGKFDGLSYQEATLQLAAQNIQIEQFNLSSAKIDISSAGTSLDFKQVEANIGSSIFKVNDLKFDLQNDSTEPYKLELRSFNLPKFLSAIGVKNVPVELIAQLDTSCQTTFVPEFFVQCKGSASGQNLEVNNSTQADKLTIAALDAFSGTGSVRADFKQVSWNVDVEVGEDKGSTQGSVKFTEGFLIKYETPRLQFSHVPQIANIPMAGEVKISGQTQGNSKSATIDMKIDAKNYQLGDFILGNLQTDLNYKSGTLSFSNSLGQLERTRYQGQVSLDLIKSTITGQIRFPYLELNDVKTAINAALPIPFQLSGPGAGQMAFTGPLALNKLSYELVTQVFRGEIAGESFDSLKVNLSSKNGNVKSDVIELKKGPGTVLAKFKLNPEFSTSTTIEAAGLRLEEMDTFNKVSSSISGSLQGKASIEGPISNPNMLISAKVKDLMMGNDPKQDSSILLEIEPNKLQATFNALGKAISGKVQLPRGNQTNYQFSILADRLDYARLIGLLNPDVVEEEYNSSISGELDLQFPSTKPWMAAGSLAIDSLLLERGRLSLSNETSIEATAKDGKINVQPFRLSGGSQFIEVESARISENQLSCNLRAQVDLAMSQLFLPFFDDIGGPASIALKLSGKPSDIQLLGSGLINDAYIKIPGLIHPFENINASLNFSQSRILIDDLKAIFAKGILSGSGYIQTKDLSQISVDVQAKLSNAQLKIPDGVRSEGDADIRITGNSFPYTLSGKYNVKDGLVSMEFIGGNAKTEQVTRSHLLPQRVTQELSPLLFDLQVVTNKPLKVKNSLADGQATATLKIKGTPTTPILEGQIASTGRTQVLFRDRLFEVETANVEFNGSSTIDPKLYLTATTRIQTYDISLVIQGTASNPTFRLDSQPPLLQEEIVSMLALGIPSSSSGVGQSDPTLSSSGSANEGQAATTAVATEVISQTTKGFGDLLGVNIQVAPDLSRDVTAPRVILSKEITPRLTATASQTTSSNARTDVTLQYRINQKVSVVGMYQSTDAEETRATETAVDNQDIFGVDLQYRVEFK